MAARKSKRSRSVISDRRLGRFGLTRPPAQRIVLPVIVIVCDDARTAVSYFSTLKRAVKHAVTLTVERNPCDRATPQNVVDAAYSQLKALRQGRARGDVSRVWALIDLEGEPSKRAAAQKAANSGGKCGISVALSDPCYELWTLLHIEDTGQTFANCGAVIARLQQRWRAEFGQDFGKKVQADYSKIIDMRATAVERAKSHRKRKDPSWTEVYRLVEEIDAYCVTADAAQSTPHLGSGE